MGVWESTFITFGGLFCEFSPLLLQLKNELQMSFATKKLSCKASYKTPFFPSMHVNNLQNPLT
jgi:hypothetical protein